MASSPRTVIYCSNCGTPNPVGSKFCSDCGNALILSPNSTPLPPIQVQVITQPPVNDSSRRRRYLFVWFPLGAILMLLLCGFSYWSTLILIPPPTNDAPVIVADLQRMLFAGQNNIEHPEWLEDFAARNEVKPDPDKPIVQYRDGQIFLNEEYCGPQAIFEIESVKVHDTTPEAIAFFGVGILQYDVINTGESLAETQFGEGEWGYHAKWVVYEDEQKKVVEHSTVYFCTSSGENKISCYGPDIREAGAAEMFIYSDNPECNYPVAIYPFVDGNPYPATNQVACQSPTLQYVSLSEDTSEMIFHSTPSSEGFAEKYILWGTDPISGEYNYTNCYNPLAQSDEVICLPPLAHLTTYQWKLLQQPIDLCTEPLASGNIGGGDVASEVCKPPFSVELSDIKLDEPDEGNLHDVEILGRGLDNNSIQGLEPEGKLWAEVTISDQTGKTTQQPSYYRCEDLGHGDGSFRCLSYSIYENETVSVKLLYETGGCKELVAEKSWPWDASRVPEAQASSTDRCSLFNENQIEFNALEWKTGEPFEFYFKIPGGVPGLEKNINGDSEDWEYSVSVGDYSSDDCKFIKNESYAKERLYCSVNIPKGAKYEFSLQTVNLFINGCNQPLFDQRSQVPQYSDAIIVVPPSGGGNSGGGGGSSGGDSCPSGQSYHDPNPSSGWAGGCCSDGHFYDYAPFGLNCWENPGP